MANIKRTFYGICEWLRSDQEHVARVLLGSACEAWLNTEAVVAMNSRKEKLLDLRREYAYTEVAKRDICVFPYDGGLPPEALDEDYAVASHVIEAKVVYAWAPSQIRSKLKTLTPQLKRRKVSPHENGDTRYTGLIHAVWSSYYGIPRPDFYKQVAQITRELFPPATYTTQHGYRVEPVIDEQEVPWIRPFRVAMGSLYVTRLA
jgi:hypothetical protein